ncbi:hypothetical protein ACIQGZ_12230 [Streptomyces sp. NPDC092296]|uniref:hypothetical protein n=1 Tax=Streptomyces sp. NPDC092296 TaxID=3366012 RepID=UPI00382DCBB8
MRSIGYCGCGATFLPPESLDYPEAGVEASLTQCSTCKPPTPIGTTPLRQRRVGARPQPVVRRPRSSRPRLAGWPADLRAGRRAGDGTPPA